MEQETEGVREFKNSGVEEFVGEGKGEIGVDYGGIGEGGVEGIVGDDGER